MLLSASFINEWAEMGQILNPGLMKERAGVVAYWNILIHDRFGVDLDWQYS